MASFSTEAGLRHLPLADARQNYTSFRYTKKSAHVRYWPVADNLKKRTNRFREQSRHGSEGFLFPVFAELSRRFPGLIHEFMQSLFDASEVESKRHPPL
jgi:hypothetical protein